MAARMILVGRLSVATPASMALAIRQPTEAQKAVDERITPVAAGIIGSDPTLAAAAATRVDQEVTNRGLIGAQSVSLPGIAVAFADANGSRSWLEINDTDGGPTDFAAGFIRDAVGGSAAATSTADYRAIARAAGNAATTRPLTIYCIGPSTVEGAGVDNPADRYIDEMGKRLHKALGIPGTYKVRFIPAFYESTSLAGAQPARTGTAAGAGAKVPNTLWLGPGGRSVMLGSSGSVQWSVNARQVRVHYSLTTDAGTPRYQIDGGASVAFPASWAGDEKCGQVSPWIDLGSTGAHTFTVTSTGGGTGTVAGIEVRDAITDATDIGIHIIDAARGGMDINNYVGAQMTRQIDSMRPFKPDVIWFGDTAKNRYGGQSDTPATVAANLDTAIVNYQAAATQQLGWPATVICTGSFGRGVTTVTLGTWKDYIDAMRTVVLARNAVWIDVSERMPPSQGDLASTAYTDTFKVFADPVHLNLEGQRWYGQLAYAGVEGLIG